MKTNQARQLRVSLAIVYLPVALFLMGARSIVVALTGNTNFPTPFPALADITMALNDLQAKIAAAVGGGVIATADRNAAWNAAKSLIRQLANYVQMHCQNDLAILLSSGFTTTKSPVPVGPLTAPRNLHLSRTNLPGQVLVRFAPVYGTLAGYNVQSAPNPEGPWTDLRDSSTSRFAIDGQTPLTTLWARVRANGAAGAGPWTAPASVVVL